jgi:hypothetical protein
VAGARKIRLDDLLGSEEPHASFHDAVLMHLHIDFTAESLLADFQLAVGNPDAVEEAARERSRRGRLSLSGLRFWAIDPPSDPRVGFSPGPWLTSDGLLEEAPTETGRRLASTAGDDAVAWYLYFSDLNAFAYCAAKQAQFEWL